MTERAKNIPICPVDFDGMRAKTKDFLAHQDPDNPYVSTTGVGHVPSRLGRRMRTPRDVVRAAQEASRLYGITAEDVAKATGLTLTVVKDVMEHGRGTMGDVLDVMEALRVSPSAIPGPSLLREGV